MQDKEEPPRGSDAISSVPDLGRASPHLRTPAFHAVPAAEKGTPASFPKVPLRGYAASYSPPSTFSQTLATTRASLLSL